MLSSQSNQVSLLDLVSLNAKCSSLSTKKYTEMLNEFMQKFSMERLIAIIFSGLYNIKSKNKHCWISFINEKINNELSNNKDKASIDENTCNLLQLHDNALTSIFQYLTIKDLSSLEICGRFLFNKLRAPSDHFKTYITSLDYPEWQVSLALTTNNSSERFSRVTKLFLLDLNSLERPWDKSNHNLLINIIPNITHLSIASWSTSIYTQHHESNLTKSSLQSLTIFDRSINISTIAKKILPKLGCKSFDELRALKFNRNYAVLDEWSKNVLLNSKLEKLHFDAGDKAICTKMYHSFTDSMSRGFGPMTPTSHPEILSLGCSETQVTQQTSSSEESSVSEEQDNILVTQQIDASLWNTLTDFKYVKGQDVDQSVTHFIGAVLSNCRYLEKLSLKNLHQADCEEIFKNGYKFNCMNLKEIYLHLSTPKIPELLDYITQGKPSLKVIDLLLWNDQMNEYYQKHGTRILNALRDLLIDQLMRGHAKLRDIKLELKSVITQNMNSDAMIHQLQKFKLLISMLVDVFTKNDIKCRKELNVTIDIVYDTDGLVPYEKYDEVCQYALGEWRLLEKLLNVLKKMKNECSSLKINVTFPIALRQMKNSRKKMQEFRSCLITKKDEYMLTWPCHEEKQFHFSIVHILIKDELNTEEKANDVKSCSSNRLDCFEQKLMQMETNVDEPEICMEREQILSVFQEQEYGNTQLKMRLKNRNKQMRTKDNKIDNDFYIKPLGSDFSNQSK